MPIKILMPGPLTTVQDRGRFGYQKSGIPHSGAMDPEAFETGNYLVGNVRGEAVLEFTLFGGSLQFTEETVFALTGADMEPVLNGNRISMNQPYHAFPGEMLSLGLAREGCRTYMAVAGGIEVPVIMGSRSTYSKCGIGGYQGRALRTGDMLEVEHGGRLFSSVADRRIPPRTFSHEITLRVVEGPQAEYFTEKGRQTFYHSVYTIEPESDRMGYRMSGAVIESKNGTDIISDGIPLGAVQVPAQGQPIILLADRQTTGGYAKIATVCSFDIPLIAQGKPGDQVRFLPVSVEESQSMLMQYRKRMDKILKELCRGLPPTDN